MRKHPYVLALAFGLACLLLMGGQAARAQAVPPPDGPTSGELQIEPGDPALGPAGFSGLILTETVSLNPTTCGTTTAITVTAGTPVTICYRLYNDSGFSLSAHNLHDTLKEDILDDHLEALGVGSTALYTRTIIATSTVTNIALWSVTQPITGYTVAAGVCTTFPDISGTGQALNLSDDGMVNLTMPFYFPLYDRFSNRLRVSNNGAALLDEPNAGISFGNAALPTAGLPHGLAVFWDDLDVQTGQVYAGMRTFTAAELVSADGTPSALLPAGVQAAGLDPQLAFDYYVVEYLQRSRLPGPTDTGTFALALHMTGEGADGQVVMCYQDTSFADLQHDPSHDFGLSATIGLNHNGSSADQFSYNTSHPTLTGTAAVKYSPIGTHAAFVSQASALLHVISTVNIPIVTR